MELSENTKLTGAVEERRTRRQVAGYLSGFLSAILLAASLGCVQALGGYIPAFQLNLWRFSGQFLLSVPVAVLKRLRFRPNKSEALYLGIVCVAYNTGNIFYFESATYLPTGTIGGVEGVAFVLFTAIASTLLTRKCCRGYLVVAILLCMIGIILLVQPHFIFGGRDSVFKPTCSRPESQAIHNESSTVHWNSSIVNANTAPKVIGLINETQTSITAEQRDVALGFLYVILATLSMTIITFSINLKLRDMNPCVISAWACISGILVSLLGMFIFETPMLPSHVSCQLLLVGHVVGVGLANLLETATILFLRPEVFSLLRNLGLVMLLLEQYTVLKKVYPGHRNAMEVCGAAAIILANCIEPVWELHDKYINEKQNMKDKQEHNDGTSENNAP